MLKESYVDEREIEENYEMCETMKKGHGRIERRSCCVMQMWNISQIMYRSERESFYWILDVNFGGDDNQIINKIAQENLNIVRKVAIKRNLSILL